MNLVKVYDKEGNHVDSFNKPKGKWIGWNSMIRILNAKGYVIKRQLKLLKKA